MKIRKVPFYRQHYDFTCGPAALMMAMKYFWHRLELTKELEIDIWREANMVEVYGTSRYGLAFSAATRGFDVRIFTNLRGAGYFRKIEPMIGKIDRTHLNYFLMERKERCRKLGIKELRVTQISTALLKASVSIDAVPIILSNTEFFSAEDAPHWLAIADLNESQIYFNNPLSRSGRQGVPISQLGQILGYKGDQCMVTVNSAK